VVLLVVVFGGRADFAERGFGHRVLREQVTEVNDDLGGHRGELFE
jgi:hypothetical protein